MTASFPKLNVANAQVTLGDGANSVFAGGGTRGGRAIGSTNETGAYTADPGWERNRSARPEDIAATIYSALGIDWTTVRHDDPLGRGFEYVPKTGAFPFAPVHELWG